MNEIHMDVDEQPPPVEPPDADEQAATQEAEAEATVTDGKGTKGVPVAKFVAAKKERQALAKQVSELEKTAGRVPELESALRMMQARIQALEPDAEAVRRLPPHVADSLRRGQPAEPDIPDSEAEEEAKLVGLYKVDGSPDVAAGRRIIQRQRQRVQHVVEAERERTREELTRTLGPVKASAMMAEANRLEGLAMARAASGFCKPDTLRGLLEKLAPEDRANYAMVNATLLIARGMDGGDQTPRDVPEPLHTESSGGRRLAPGPLSDLEKRAAKIAGETDEDWKKRTNDWQPGKAYRLE